MDGLRWLLLGFGVLAIVGVYLYTRKQAQRADEPPSARREPSLDDSDHDPELISAELDGFTADPLPEEGAEPALLTDADDPAEDETPLPQKIVTLRLLASERKPFPGDDLILNMRGLGMRHGQFGIFHQYDGDDETKVVFSAASLTEPGSFDLVNLQDQTFPGISLFMVLPGPLDGVQAFDGMVESARTLAQSLDGELLDESGSTLSIQRERYIREEIIQYQHGMVVA